jgi:hypothetical protein
MLKQLLDLIRRARRSAVPVAAAAMLVACANPAPISSNPIADIPTVVNQLVPGSATDVAALKTQFANAEWNLTTAQTDGLLSPNDPMPACSHGINVFLGIDASPTPALSFTPRETGLFDTGSVVYILAQQALAMKQAGIQVSPACEQLVGHITILATQQVIQGAAGALTGGLANQLPIPLPLLGTKRPVTR